MRSHWRDRPPSRSAALQRSLQLIPIIGVHLDNDYKPIAQPFARRTQPSWSIIFWSRAAG